MFKHLWLVISILILVVAETVSASLVAHWNFNETNGTTAFDSVGNINGMLAGGATFTGTGGIAGGAIEVTNGYVDMGNNFPSTSTFSIQSWIKIDSGDISPMTPVSKHQAGIGQGYYLSVNDVSDGFTQENLAGFRSISSVFDPTATGLPVVNDGQWHQLVGVYDNGTSMLFVDGELSASTLNGFSNNAANFLVGGVVDFSGIPVNVFNGLIDEVKVFDDALSEIDVRELYNNTLIPIPASVWLFASSLLGLWGITRKQINLK